MNIPLILLWMSIILLWGTSFIALYLIYVVSKEVDKFSLLFMKFRSDTHNTISVLKNKLNTLIENLKEEEPKL